MRAGYGFTLIEIALVLLIIGLMVGSVIKGQELIYGARVRNLAMLHDGAKGAFFGFLDRYRSFPGDYARATININGTTTNGDGDGQIELVNTGGTAEHIAAWEHLSRAGFMTGTFTYNATPSAATSPTNFYGIPLQLVYDNVYADVNAAPSTKHNLKTGNQIPADIVAEVDRKIDDGNARLGTFRFSTYTQGGTAPVAANCHALGVWDVQGSVESNCGGVNLF